jgi:hypothetical protein
VCGGDLEITNQAMTGCAFAAYLFWVLGPWDVGLAFLELEFLAVGL